MVKKIDVNLNQSGSNFQKSKDTFRSGCSSTRGVKFDMTKNTTDRNLDIDISNSVQKTNSDNKS